MSFLDGIGEKFSNLDINNMHLGKLALGGGAAFGLLAGGGMAGMFQTGLTVWAGAMVLKTGVNWFSQNKNEKSNTPAPQAPTQGKNQHKSQERSKQQELDGAKQAEQEQEKGIKAAERIAKDDKTKEATKLLSQTERETVKKTPTGPQPPSEAKEMDNKTAVGMN
jgi:uncharacterized membrane protein YebE (DUF533 family)